MTKLFLFLTFAVACALHAWLRLSEKTRTRLTSKAKTMINRMQAFVANRIMRRRLSYRAVFLDDRGELNAAGRTVLADLTKFCRALTSTTVVSKAGSVDPIASALAEGRREVWLRIMKELNLDPSMAIAAMKEEDALAA